MTENQDLLLQTLFAEAQQDLSAEAFTARVMTRTQILRYRVAVGLICVALALAICAWLLALPAQEIAQLIVQGLNTTLLDLGDGWPAWLLAPVNNIASLFVLSLKGILTIRKKTIGASYKI